MKLEFLTVKIADMYNMACLNGFKHNVNFLKYLPPLRATGNVNMYLSNFKNSTKSALRL